MQYRDMLRGLDRYITGNYGEDQFPPERKPMPDDSPPDEEPEVPAPPPEPDEPSPDSQFTCVRDLYIEGHVSHRAYYSLWAELIGYGTLKRIVARIVSRDLIRDALMNGDRHLNTIPLARWDSCNESVRKCPRNINAQLLITGSTGSSLSDTVCLLKEVARRWAEEPTIHEKGTPCPAET